MSSVCCNSKTVETAHAFSCGAKNLAFAAADLVCMLLLLLAGEHGASFLRPQAKLSQQCSLVSCHTTCFEYACRAQPLGTASGVGTAAFAA
jgi:hypothetical protein